MLPVSTDPKQTTYNDINQTLIKTSIYITSLKFETTLTSLELNHQNNSGYGHTLKFSGGIHKTYLK